MPFNPPDAVPMELLPDGQFRTAADLSWTGSSGDQVLIPRGTVTDFGTVPWVLRAILAVIGRGARGMLLHDVLCYQLRLRYEHKAVEPPVFDSIDTDGVFRKVLGELAVPDVLRWLYWTGVRWGALGNPARRGGWWRTAPLVIVLSVLYAAPVLIAAAGALIAATLLWVGSLAMRLGWLLLPIVVSLVYCAWALPVTPALLALLLFLLSGATADTWSRHRRAAWLFAGAAFAVYVGYLVLVSA